MINGEISGIGTCIVHHDVAWLAHIIVHPNHRNKGIGKRITEQLIDLSHKKGCKTINLIATDLGEPVYRKAGFEMDTEYLVFKDITISDTAGISENIVSYATMFKNQIEELDRHTSGEDRMHHLESYLKGSYVYHSNGDVKGFYLPEWGEGLIIASTEDAGIGLMKMRFTTKQIISFPVDNASARHFMHRHGQKEFRKITRMRMGDSRLWVPENIYGRIGGNLG